MPRLKLFHDCTPSIGGGALLFFLMQPGHMAAGTLRVDSQAYVDRGDRVEKNYLTYSKRLERHYDAVIAAVKEYAPDLLPLFQSPESASHGYQILPRIVAISTAEMRARTGAVAYSWPWTDHLIDKELAEIADGETKLRHAAEVNSTERRAILKNLAQNYRELNGRLGNIHAHVQYNRLWQAAIAADRSGYDRETTLFNDVVERQKIIDRLNRLRGGLKTSRLADVRLAVLELTGGLREREALLRRRIDQEMGQPQTPNFIKIENLDNEWVFHVPLITDIEDHEYVLAVKAAIENAWRLRDGSVEYRIELEVTHISAKALYSDEERPMQGQKIDIRHHLARFSSDAAILTTGGRTTHVQRHAIVLGPHPITPHVLAHEFGHILGFRDRYVRGYENLGEHGFRVMEVVADDSDVMAATGYGTVGRRHFVELSGPRTSRSQLPKRPEEPAENKFRQRTADLD